MRDQKQVYINPVRKNLGVGGIPYVVLRSIDEQRDCMHYNYLRKAIASQCVSDKKTTPLAPKNKTPTSILIMILE